MTKSENTQQQQGEALAATQSPQTSSSQIPAKPSRIGTMFAILLSLVALSASAYIWYDIQILNKDKESALTIGVMEINAHVQRLGDSINRLQAEQDKAISQAELGASLTTLENQLDLKLRELSARQLQLTELVNKLGSDLAKGTNEYAEAEVFQLLKFANHSLNFSKDVAAAKNALQLADDHLKELSDPRYSQVRQQLNQELASLDNLYLPDVAQISGTIQAIVQLVPNLELENETPAVGPVEMAPALEAQGVFGQFKQIGRDILAWLEPQRIDTAPKPLLAPEQRYFLDQNIQLMLNKAELAMMQNQTEIYRSSLASAKQMLDDYYAPHDPEVSKTLEQIEGLQNKALLSELPDISGSFTMLKGLQDN